MLDPVTAKTYILFIVNIIILFPSDVDLLHCGRNGPANEHNKVMYDVE